MSEIRPPWACSTCPTCHVPANEKHQEGCQLIKAARDAFEDEDCEIVIPDRACIEDVGEGNYRVEASVYIGVYDLEDAEDEEEKVEEYFAATQTPHGLLCGDCLVDLNDQCLEGGCLEAFDHASADKTCSECKKEVSHA